MDNYKIVKAFILMLSATAIVMLVMVYGNIASADPVYNHYRGSLHSHTTLSDGKATLAQAYQNVKDNGGDYLAITDHAEHFDNRDNWHVSTEWAGLKAAADQATDSTFVGIAAFEISWAGSVGWIGHINTFNTDWFENCYKTGMNLPIFYNRMKQDPTSFSQWNHPGLFTPTTHFGTFDDFGFYDAQIDDQMPLMEVAFIEQHLEHFNRALDKGWHIAPSNNNDNHALDNFYPENHRTVLLATSLTRANLYDAIRNRRAYATTDGNITVNYTVNGSVMGSRLKNPGTLSIAVNATDPDAGDNISRVQIIANGGRVVASQDYGSTSVNFTASLSPSYKYYYAIVDQADGGRVVTAPVWIMDPIPLTISMTAIPTSNPSVPVQVDAYIMNTGATILSDVQVNFRDTTNSNVIGSANISTLPVNTPTKASVIWAPLSGSYQIFAEATVSIGGTTKAVTSSIAVPDLQITEIVCNSDASFLYNYIELYNNAKYSINLKNYKIIYQRSNYTEDVWNLDDNADFVIPAKGAAVIWVASSMSNTLDQFNSYYGTNLTSGQVYQIVPPNGGKLDNTAARGVVIQTDTDVVSCGVLWNYNQDLNKDTASVKKSIVYKYPTDGRQIMQKIAAGQMPTPGIVLAKQLPGSALDIQPNTFSTISDSFSSGSGNWTPKSGTWAVSSGVYTQTNTSVNGQLSILNSRIYEDFTLTFNAKIVSTLNGDNSHWIGATIRNAEATSPFEGYCIGLRNNGELFIFRANTTLASAQVPGYLPGYFIRLRVVVNGSNIKVFAGGIQEPVIDIQDEHFRAGYIGLSNVGSNVQYDNVTVSGIISGIDNKANGKDLYYSSTYNSANWNPCCVVDGKRTSVAQSYGYTSNNDTAINHTEWLKIDLLKEYPINRVDIYPRSDAGYVGQGFPLRFKIETSADNINWVTQYQTSSDYTLPDSSVQSFSFSTTTAKFVRITGTSLRQVVNEYRMQFAEVEVY